MRRPTLVPPWRRWAVSSLGVWLSTWLVIDTATSAAPGDTTLFRDSVAPIFQRHCLPCHNAAERRGGLSLSTAADLRAGGDSGAVIVAGEPDASYLLDLVTPEGDQAEMPQAAAPLKAAEIETLRQWIAAGAPWPDDYPLQPPVWWSLRPLTTPTPPALTAAHGSGSPESLTSAAANPIDAFLGAALDEQGLSTAPEADCRTLIRRLAFDLLGLPPSPAEVEAFAADSHPLAYERLVDRLLASPHYGERWARHWLDVVHYGETHGYDKDKPRENAWPYRDYVIRAMNLDKPYARFIQEQIAGDRLFPGTRDGIEALGFIAAGPWDFIGHVEVPESKTDGKIARHLDRDDMVQNTIGTFLSLTVGCAQCHDHRFDPIPQHDYYSLQAMFSALDRIDRPYDIDPAIAAQREALESRRTALEQQQQRLTAAIAAAGGEELASLDQRIAAARSSRAERPAEHGYHSQIAATPDETKWVEIDLGESIPISRIEFVACEDDFNGIGAGFGFPRRYKIELAEEPFPPEGVSPAAAPSDLPAGFLRVTDRTEQDVENPGIAPQHVDVPLHSARYVRFTATRLAARQNDFIFALAELRVLDAEGTNRASARPVMALDSIEAPVRWRRENLVDGLYPSASAASPAEQAALIQEREQWIATRIAADVLAERAQGAAELEQVRAQLEQLPPPRRVYAGGIHHGSGSFRGTGPDGGTPRPIYFLARGDVTRAQQEVVPGVLSCLDEHLEPPQLGTTAGDGERRAALAAWLSDSRNPLTWRSIANRLWLYHFGRGLVDTPGDFGRMGEPPSHPELLDWLACQIRDHGGSLKRVQRMIVMSAAYRQRSAVAPSQTARQVDPDNRLYWRMNRRRLEAEAVRDAMLLAAGRLDRRMGGPSYRDFVIEKPEHSPHYQYHLHDPNDPAAQRRTVYRFIVRSQGQPLMTALDCADPSMQVGRRNQANTPLQALAMLNNQLPLAMSKHFAVRAAAAGSNLEDQVRAAFQRALSRTPEASELDTLVDYAGRYGLAATCRVILNLNEFLFVD